MDVSHAAMIEKPQHVPQGFWYLTGVTIPWSRRSYVLGRSELEVASSEYAAASPESSVV